MIALLVFSSISYSSSFMTNDLNRTEKRTKEYAIVYQGLTVDSDSEDVDVDSNSMTDEEVSAYYEMLERQKYFAKIRRRNLVLEEVSKSLSDTSLAQDNSFVCVKIRDIGSSYVVELKQSLTLFDPKKGFCNEDFSSQKRECDSIGDIKKLIGLFLKKRECDCQSTLQAKEVVEQEPVAKKARHEEELSRSKVVRSEVLNLFDSSSQES